MLSIYCDGSCHARGGLPGGWAFILVRKDLAIVTRAGGEKKATNNQMELRAALLGLREVVALGLQAEGVELVSDSRFTLDIANGSYLPKKDLEQAWALREAAVAAGAATRWVRGHSGDPWNERADALAHEAKQALVPLRVRRKASGAR